MSSVAIRGAPLTSAPSSARAVSIRVVLLACGIAGAIIYPVADIIAASRYPGFSYRDQAVSELFAIGAPTSGFVVSLFTASSTLLLLFAVGMWMSARGSRLMRPAAVLMALNTIDALVLWNFFPMHMRGVPPTFTDTMHGALAIDPFLLAAIILTAVAFRGRFRMYTVASLLFSSVFALTALVYVPMFIANQPTPGMGLCERAGQYATNVWYAIFAVMLLRRGDATTAR